MAASDPIRDKRQLKQLAQYYLQRGQLRNYCLIILGVHTALRVSDLLRLTWYDVYDFDADAFKTHVSLTEMKTGKPKTVALNNGAIRALRLYLPHRRGMFLFANNRKDARAISRVQAYRIIRKAAEAVHIAGNIACHSLRKTFGYFAWKAGVLPVMLMDIYNHSSYDITRRYLGISQDDRDKVYLGVTLF